MHTNIYLIIQIVIIELLRKIKLIKIKSNNIILMNFVNLVMKKIMKIIRICTLKSIFLGISKSILIIFLKDKSKELKKKNVLKILVK